MSKIGSEKMKAAIHEMLTLNHKERKFKETIDLQIGLKDYDINKDKRFSGVSSFLMLFVPDSRFVSLQMLSILNNAKKPI